MIDMIEDLAKTRKDIDELEKRFNDYYSCNAPYIGENNNWFVYENISESYIDSGVKAIGEQGPKGDKGDKGDQGIPGIQGIPGPKGDDGADGTNGTVINRGSFTISSVTANTDNTINITMPSNVDPTKIFFYSYGSVGYYFIQRQSNNGNNWTIISRWFSTTTNRTVYYAWW